MITPEELRAIYITKNLKPVQGLFNVRIEGGKFVAGDNCCAVSAIVHGEAVNEGDLNYAVARAARAAVAVAIHHSNFFPWANFDHENDPHWLVVKDLAGE